MKRGQAKKMTRVHATSAPPGWGQFFAVTRPMRFYAIIAALFLSVLFHVGIFVPFVLVTGSNTAADSMPVSLTFHQPEPPEPEERQDDIVEKVPEKNLQKVRKAEVRPENNIHSRQEEQEVRAGVLASDAEKAKVSAPVGNSAEAVVHPEDAELPKVGAGLTEESEAVPESAVDVPADCPAAGELTLTDEAVGAGVTSGQIVIELSVAKDGQILQAIVKKGIGFGVDELALAAVEKMRCKPAMVHGSAVAVRNKKLIWDVVY